MPKICFEAVPQKNNKMEIVINESEQVKATDICSTFNSIQFSNENGILSIKGSFDFIKYTITYSDLITLEYLKLKFCKEFSDSLCGIFNRPDISVKFYLKPEDEDFINNSNLVVGLKKDLSEHKLCKRLNKITDINLYKILINAKNEEYKANGQLFKTFENEDDEIVDMNDSDIFLVDKNNINNECQKIVSSNAFENEDEIRDYDIPFFQKKELFGNFKVTPKIVFKSNILNQDFIDFSNSDYCLNKVSKQQVINPINYIHSNINNKFEFFIYGSKFNFYLSSLYQLMPTKNDVYFSYYFKQLFPYDNTSSIYKKETFRSFMENLIKHYSDNYPSNFTETSVLYTNIINDYLNDLDTFLGCELNENLDSIVIKKLIKKEKETIQLLKYLFLVNIPNANEIVDKKMRKKLLIKWLIDTLEESFKEQINNINDPKEKILFCIVNGQIKEAIKISKSLHMVILTLLLTQLNNQYKGNEFYKDFSVSKFSVENSVLRNIYQILSQKNDIITNKDNYELNYLYYNNCDWKNILIQLCLFYTRPETSIEEIFFLLENIINKKEREYPKLKPRKYNDILDIDYYLINLYSTINNKDNNTINNILNKISYTKNFNEKKNNDHHLQFIISLVLYILTKKSHPSFKTIFKLMFGLLKKTIEENIDNTYIEEIPNYLLLFNMISCIPIPMLLKKNMLNTMLNKTNLNNINPILFLNVVSDEKTINKVIAYFNKNQLKYNEALIEFEKGGLFHEAALIRTEKDLNSIINNNNKNNINQIIKEDLEIFKGYHNALQSSTFNYEISNIFENYLYCINFEYNNKTVESMILKISQLIKKLIEIKTEDISIIKYKDYMYKNLRQKLNEICQKTWINYDQFSDNLYLPINNNNIIKKKDIIFDTKNKELKLNDDTIIYTLNKKYCK